jgi:signal transduction histidine kinase
MIQNLPIRSKLVAILLLPMLALGFLAASRVVSSVSDSLQADRVDRVTRFAVGLEGLVHELQKERDLSAGYVGSGKKGGYGAMVGQRVWVNQALAGFRTDVRRIDFGAYGPRLGERLAAADRRIGGLADQRRTIDTEGPVRLEDTLRYYDDAIGGLIDVAAEIPAESGDRPLVRDLQSMVALARAKEATASERSFVYAVLSAGSFQAGQYQRFATMVGAEQTWLSQYLASATDQQRRDYSTTMTGPDVNRAATLQDQVLDQDNGAAPAVSARDWFFAMNAKVDLLRQVETGLAADVLKAASSSRGAAAREAVIATVIVVLILALSIGLSVAMARSMVRSLRLLKDAANDIAERKLPEAVERLSKLQHPEPADLELGVDPIDVHSRDEIGQVADAFNSVHRVAVQVATEQAALRRSVGDMFLNLARRNQALIDRQLELIDELERNEIDPESLEELFRLDHLATRMRRNAEDLIVLSGAKPARRWSQPVSLADAVRAALAEVEDYTRVELLPVDDLGIIGQAVGDIVHLLAELIENATAFSPPGTKVHIAGQPVAGGYVVEIEDRGIGMTDAELVEANARLARPPTIDLTLSQRLGLFVVGRLAQRYGIKVQLRHSWYDGVTALVLLPDSLLVRPVSERIGTNGQGRLGLGNGRPYGEHVPAALPPPPAPSEPARPEPEPEIPVADGGPDGLNSGDHLPIFEAARSDWFESGDPSGRTTLPPGPPPVQPRPVQPPPVQPAAPDAGRPLPRRERRTPPPQQRPTGPVRAPAAARPAPRTRGFDPSGTTQQLRPAAERLPPVGPSRPVRPPEHTDAGLPRRVPRANLAPGMSGASPSRPPRQPGTGPPGLAGRSPDDIRSMLSDYRSGFERGRHEASSGEDAQSVHQEQQ